jgi:hypothetical protein
MSRKARNKPSKCRAVGYRWGWKVPVVFDESQVEALLLKAKQEGVVIAFDTGRGNALWFNGFPGKAMRALVSKVRSLLTPNVPSESDE